MAADVEECLDAVILAAHRDQGLAEKIQRVVVAGIRNVVEVADYLPGRRKYPLLLGVEKIRVAVDPARQTEAVQIGGDRAIDSSYAARFASMGFPTLVER